MEVAINVATSMDDDEGQGATPYARRVGERLRAIRRQQRLSLQDVEAASQEEFKASVLGAYERGERAISVPRLQRLARFYSVPVDQLLPPDEGPAFPGQGQGPENDKLVLDLGKLEQSSEERATLLERFCKMIQLERQDFNGRVLTVRGADLPAIAAMLGVTPQQVQSRIDELDIRFRPE